VAIQAAGPGYAAATRPKLLRGAAQNEYQQRAKYNNERNDAPNHKAQFET